MPYRLISIWDWSGLVGFDYGTVKASQVWSDISWSLSLMVENIRFSLSKIEVGWVGHLRSG